jgi:hypothetical protein
MGWVEKHPCVLPPIEVELSATLFNGSTYGVVRSADEASDSLTVLETT